MKNTRERYEEKLETIKWKMHYAEKLLSIAFTETKEENIIGLLDPVIDFLEQAVELSKDLVQDPYDKDVSLGPVMYIAEKSGKSVQDVMDFMELWK